MVGDVDTDLVGEDCRLSECVGTGILDKVWERGRFPTCGGPPLPNILVAVMFEQAIVGSAVGGPLVVKPAESLRVDDCNVSG